jgi:hypothetical protein
LPPEAAGAFEGFAKIQRTPLAPQPTFEFVGAKPGIIVEPTVLLDQRARYLDHLHELRRINEGDDTADSPGYALDLVRIPVSVLPGKCTAVGYGAEVTMTLTPYLSDELLPTTFRNLILNDLLDQIGFPVTQFINNPENRAYFDERSAADLDALIQYVEQHSLGEMVRQPQELAAFRWKPVLQAILARPEWSWVDLAIATARAAAETATRNTPGFEQYLAAALANVDLDAPHWEAIQQEWTQHRDAELAQTERSVRDKQTEAVGRLAAAHTVSIPATKSRRARLPFPPSQLVDVYGYDFLFHISLDTFRTFAKERVARPCPDADQLYIHLPDVQGYLQEELAGAYKFLANPCNADLWQLCTPDLAAAIRTHDAHRIAAVRQEFKNRVQLKTPPHSLAAALAWATLVEAALLTEQLVQDMHEAAAARGCACGPGGWLPYFLPEPPPEARQAFNDYVRCRWPIHVFALDPVVEEQNIADTFSGRREMQLAMSLAFVSGRLSARNMMRYARRIEFDFATVDLNGTAVGFSHGDDTFGWRFYPRFQSPDIESNTTVLFRDLLVGGPSKDALLRQRRLEPGMRECVAIVIMPSFVPYATLHTSSNWFKLTNPERKELDSTQAMRLSKLVKEIQTCAGNVGDANCYRDGDFDRLLHKGRQLEARLPLQSTMVQIPYENTLGGFAMFNTGVTDLAPELTGWYGSPSINPAQPTTLFLVGNHFSVHQTRVIAGGQPVTDTEMLSRQVIKVVIPPGPILLGDAGQQFVDVHLATPYGVTQHLLIPVCTAAGGDTVKGLAWKPAVFEMAYVYGGLGITAPPADPKYRPPGLVLRKGDVDPARYPTVDITLKAGGGANVRPIVLPGVAYVAAQDGYVVAGDRLAAAVFAAAGARFGPEATNPPMPLVLAADLKFQPVPGGTPRDDKAVNALTITWVRAPRCCP